MLSDPPQIVTERVHLQLAKICRAEIARRTYALNEGAAVLVVEGTGFSEVEVPAWYQILYYQK